MPQLFLCSKCGKNLPRAFFHPETMRCKSCEWERFSKELADKTQSAPPSEGVKADRGKWRFSLLPWGALKEVIHVLEFGANKYAENNWMQVDNHRQRYFDAAIRHLTAWYAGERLDAESGLHHLAHAGCCILFLLARDKKDG